MDHTRKVEAIWLGDHTVDIEVSYDFFSEDEYDIRVFCCDHLVKLPLRSEWMEIVKTQAEYLITDHEWDVEHDNDV